MIPTTIIPRPVRPLTEEEHKERLAAQRARTIARINYAVEQQRYWALRNHDELRAWITHEQSLRVDLEMIDGDIAWRAKPKDERYAEVRAQMRHYDKTREVVSDGSVRWEEV